MVSVKRAKMRLGLNGAGRGLPICPMRGALAARKSFTLAKRSTSTPETGTDAYWPHMRLSANLARGAVLVFGRDIDRRNYRLPGVSLPQAIG